MNLKSFSILLYIAFNIYLIIKYGVINWIAFFFIGVSVTMLVKISYESIKKYKNNS